MIHNAANPFATHEELECCFAIFKKNIIATPLAVLPWVEKFIPQLKKQRLFHGMRRLKLRRPFRDKIYGKLKRRKLCERKIFVCV